MSLKSMLTRLMTATGSESDSEFLHDEMESISTLEPNSPPDDFVLVRRKNFMIGKIDDLYPDLNTREVERRLSKLANEMNKFGYYIAPGADGKVDEIWAVPMIQK